MKTRVVIFGMIVMGLLLAGILASGQGAAAKVAQATRTATAQPEQLIVETGANAPLVCGAIAILIIIIGGVIWSARFRKSAQQDH